MKLAVGALGGISMRQFVQFAALAAVFAAMPVAALRGDEASAKIRLADKGIRVTHYGLTLTDEAALAKEFHEANTLKRSCSPRFAN